MNLPETLRIVAMAKLCGKHYGKKVTITGSLLRLNFLDLKYNVVGCRFNHCC